MPQHILHCCFLFAIFLSGVAFAADNKAAIGDDAYNDRFIAERAPVIAFTNANVIDGTGAEARPNHTVIIQGGRITAIGPDGAVSVPEGAKRISLKGKSLTPGWVMTHEHLYYWHLPDNVPFPAGPYPSWPWIERIIQTVAYPRLHLSAGVTSARVVGTYNPWGDLEVKHSINKGILVGPDYDLSMFIHGDERNPYYGVADAQSAREAVRFWINRGMTTIKAYAVRGPRLQAIIDEAHKMGVKVTADLGGSLEGHREAIDYGIDQLEHVIAGLSAIKLGEAPIPLNSEPAIAHMQHYIDNGVEVSMTMSEWDNIPAPDHVLALFTDYDRKQVEKSHLGPAFIAAAFGDGSYLQRQQQVAYAFWRQGGTITLGTDAVFGDHIAGYSNLRTVELTVDAGIPNLEVIKMATHNGAKVIGIADDRGTLEVGKRADLIVMVGDPSTDIKAIYNIETVFKNGVGYDPTALIESVKGTVGGPG